MHLRSCVWNFGSVVTVYLLKVLVSGLSVLAFFIYIKIVSFYSDSVASLSLPWVVK